jgi:tRNA pseudouridine38-40 synthase
MRVYSYYLKNKKYNIEKILSASSIFTGTHNFLNFARLETGKKPSRTIENIFLDINDELIQIDFYAQTFLWNQIRRIISAIIKVGTAEIDSNQILSALENPYRKIDFGLSPAEPLVLKNIFYDFRFSYDNIFSNNLLNFERKIISSILS